MAGPAGHKGHHLGVDVGPRHCRGHVSQDALQRGLRRRAALGTDASGASRLITDRSTGTYRLADDVTVDVLRFVQMAERGFDIEDPHAAVELCRAALQLIDDTPVGNGSGRYGWWSSMWEARIGRLATKAAGRLGELARHGVIDLEVPEQE